MPRALLVLLLLTTTFASAKPIELPKSSEKWITLSVDEFTFVSSVSAAETMEVARDILRMREAIGRITNLRVRSSKPTRIFLFPSEVAFAPYRKAIMRQTTENIRGFFSETDGGNFIVMRSDSAGDVDRTVYHELTHYFVRNTTATFPLWAFEGVAHYLSTFRTSGDSFQIGQPIAEHVQVLQLEKLLPLRNLLAVTVDSPIYRGHSTSTGVFHAQSWALYHYLADDAKRRAQLVAYHGLVEDGKPMDEAFAEAFGRSYAAMEAELAAYVRKNTFVVLQFPLSDLVLPDIPKPQPLSREALLYELGHLLVHSSPQSAADARRMLEKVLALNPSHAGAHADLGWLHHAAGRRREADAAYARAVKLGSNDPLVHLLVGASALERSQSGADPDPQASVLQARKAFERAVELDPRSASAWANVGVTYVASPEDPAPGIVALEKSLALAPGNADAAFNLVRLYTRVGRRADAQRLIDTVLTRGATPETLAYARELILLAEAEDLNASGKTAEAAELARAIAARTKEAALKAHLEARIAAFDSVTNFNRAVYALGDAVKKANAGRYDEALAIVERVQAESTDPQLLAEAKRLRAEFESLRAKKR